MAVHIYSVSYAVHLFWTVTFIILELPSSTSFFESISCLFFISVYSDLHVDFSSISHSESKFAWFSVSTCDDLSLIVQACSVKMAG